MIATLLGAALLALVAAAGFVRLGLYDVSATSSHTGIVYRLLETTLKYSVRARAAGIEVPPLQGPQRLALGAASLPNTHETFSRWLRAPQHLHRGMAMPGMGLTEPHARLIAAYLLNEDGEAESPSIMPAHHTLTPVPCPGPQEVIRVACAAAEALHSPGAAVGAGTGRASAPP